MDKTISNSELESIRKVKNVCRALDHAFRKKILDHLLNNGPCNVTQLIIYTREKQCVVSQHLAILRAAKLVTTEKKGKERYYSANMKSIKHYLENSLTFIGV